MRHGFTPTPIGLSALLPGKELERGMRRILRFPLLAMSSKWSSGVRTIDVVVMARPEDRATTTQKAVIPWYDHIYT